MFTAVVNFLQIMFDTDFTKAQPSTVAVPPGYPNIFSYIIYKVLKGGGEALNSLYPPWMHVSYGYGCSSLYRYSPDYFKLDTPVSIDSIAVISTSQILEIT